MKTKLPTIDFRLLRVGFFYYPAYHGQGRLCLSMGPLLEISLALGAEQYGLGDEVSVTLRETYSIGWDEQRTQSMPVIKAAKSWPSVQGIGQMEIILKQMGQLRTPRYPYRSGQPRYILLENVVRVLLNELSTADGMKKAQEEDT